MVQPATVDPDTTCEHQRHGGSTVDQIAVVPMINPCTDDHHALSVCDFGRFVPLAGKPDYRIGADTGIDFLPRRGINRIAVVIPFRVIAVQSPVNTILCHHQIINSCEGHFSVLRLQIPHRHAPFVGLHLIKTGEINLQDGIVFIQKTQQRAVFFTRFAVFILQIPVSLLLLPAMPRTAPRTDKLTVLFVNIQKLPVAIFNIFIFFQKICPQQPAGDIIVALLAELYQKWRIRVFLCVFDKIRDLLLSMCFFQNNVGNRHPECSVLSGVHRYPLVGIF